MENVEILAADLSPAQKSAIEQLFGRKLADSELVALSPLPNPAEQEQARKALIEWLTTRAGDGTPTGGEIDEDVVTEAMRSVRPTYRPIS